MKTLAATFAVLFLGILLASSGLGCGGGGNGTTPTPTPTPTPPIGLHTGTYFYSAFWGNFAGPSAVAWWGDYLADGAGMVTGGTLGANNNGAVAVAPVAPFPYAVDAARRITWSAGTPAEHIGGIEGTDGRVLALGTTQAAAFPAMALGLRRSGTFSTASLSGVYHVLACYRAGATNASFWGTATFDGVGGVTWAVTQNTAGAIAPGVYPPGTYAVAADGTVTIALATAALRGGMLAGGEIAIVSGTTLPAAPQLLMILVRQSTTASVATLSGSYHYVFLSLLLGGPPHFRSVTGTATPDGAGMLTLTAGGISNTDGAIMVGGASPPAPYVVAADGTLTVAGVYPGAVSPSGTYAALSGVNAGGSPPALWFLVR